LRRKRHLLNRSSALTIALEPDEWSDGDSFRVRLPGSRSETFRLYFVDTTESLSRGKRSDVQAAYFGLTRAQAIELGRQAKIFTASAASALVHPFTICTLAERFGPTRYYAIVITSGGRDLNEVLVSSGLARIYGTPTPLPDGRDSREYLAHLHPPENEAKAAKRSEWVWCSREVLR
jgi:endonuclease YncB( thermonuclease family)